MGVTSHHHIIIIITTIVSIITIVVVIIMIVLVMFIVSPLCDQIERSPVVSSTVMVSPTLKERAPKSKSK
jgi:hypothetical protein